MSSQTLMPPPPARPLLTLSLIVGLLLMPFVLASVLFFGGWTPGHTSQHGRLLSPPPPLPASGPTTADGQPLASAELQGKWLLVLRVETPCTAACLARIDEIRRIQVSLNKDMVRLRRVVLATSANDPALTAAVAAQPDLLVAAAPAGWLGDGDRAALNIVDPQGRRVMEYDLQASPSEIRSDLERLLKFAWTG